MKLSIKEVEHIARLARLRLSHEEVEKFSKQLSSILDYVEKLKNVDTKSITPLSQVNVVENVYREDIVEVCSEETRKKLLENASEREDDLVKTRSVF